MKKLRYNLIPLLAFSLLFALSVFGNKVNLDQTFNGTGYNIKDLSSSPSVARATSFALQPDGKTIIGGNTLNYGTQTGSFVLMRMNTDGTLDTSFGSGGTVFTTVNRYSLGGCVLVQPDGKILIAGRAAAVNEQFNYAVVRYNSDGQLDTTFNGTGFVSYDFESASSDEFSEAALQPDGKIVLVGRTFLPDVTFDIGVIRLNSNGSLDTSFNGTGKLRIGSPNINEEGYAVSIQTDGKIVVGGSQQNPDYKFLIARLNANGTFDNSFGTNGITTTGVGTQADAIRGTAIFPNGKIIAAGSGRAARYNSNGTLDTTFGTGGVAPVTIEVKQVIALDDNRFYIISRYGAQRFLANGGLDTKYGAAPFFNDFHCEIERGVLSGNNKIMMGGNCYTRAGNNSLGFGALRFEEFKSKRYLDFDGNDYADLSLHNPSGGQWKINNFTTVQFGNSTDRPVPADFTGDGRTDIAVFRPSTGEWLVMRSENGTFYSTQFGSSGDIPVADDYDGDQIADIAVYRPSNNVWYIWKSTGGITYEAFGAAGDKPVPSDYDGDFKTDIAIYRPAGGEWWIHRSSDNSTYAFQFGTAGDKPVQGDYTGDNKTDAAFWRPSTGQWFVLRSEDYSYYAFPWGLSDDLPAPSNIDGDSRFDAVVYRPSTNRWYILTAEGSFIQKDFGTSGDIPVANYFVP